MKVSLLAVATLLSATLTSAFVNNNQISSQKCTTRTSQGKPQAMAFHEAEDLISALSPIALSLGPGGIGGPPPSDTAVEAELLQVMAHVVLDLSSFMTPPELTLRLCSVVGRVLAMAADYLPDHSMRTDDFAFNVALLAISSAALIESLLPIIQAHFKSKDISFRDRKAYLSLFNRSSLGWQQYKVLSAVAMQWIDAPPGSVLESQESLYWIYNGSVVDENEKTIPAERGVISLVGDVQFQKSLQEGSTFAAGSLRAHPTTGATVLKIDTNRLHSLMKDDPKLQGCIRNLLFLSVQQKLNRALDGANNMPSYAFNHESW